MSSVADIRVEYGVYAVLAVCGMWWLIAYWVNKKSHGLCSEWWRVLHIFLALTFFVVLFSVSPMRPIKDYREADLFGSASCQLSGTGWKDCNQWERDKSVLGVFKLEAEKAQTEISERLKHVDEWFHYKFMLVGLLFGTFIGYVVKEGSLPNGAPYKKSSPIDGDLDKLLKSPTCCIVVAMGCTVAIAVDIHIRNDIVAIQQLGSWIAYHAEPHMSGIPFEDETVLFWEKFLRRPDNSMHNDLIYGLIFYPHLHFLTWVIYVLYLWLFQNICLIYREDGNKADHKSDCWVVFATFLVVHLSLFAFVLMATLSPRIFEFLLPYVEAKSEKWSPPWETCILYILVWVILITISAQYIVMLMSKCHACISTGDKTARN